MTEKNLRDNIDEPIRRCIAGMALLGFKTVFSCCGFNYKGQPKDRSHLIGKPYMYLEYTASSFQYLPLLMMSTSWRLNFLTGRKFDFFGQGWNGSNHIWNKEESIHHYEAAAIQIQSLENRLTTDPFFLRHMLDEVEIVDGNHEYKKQVKHWQIDGSEPWLVTKENFLNNTL